MLTVLEQQEAEAILVRLSSLDECARFERLRDFVEGAWHVVEAKAFVPNWHIDVLCEQLEAVTRGECHRLLVNVPPGTAKSLIVSVFWPAWEWATDPSKRYLCASYGQDLATRDAVKTRVLVESEWYQALWPTALRDDQNQKTRYELMDGGWRIATSVGGRGTGEHPDRIIIDDPHNAQQAQSDLERQAAIDWFTQTVSTRGVTRDAAIVVIMQRLHESDLSGHILAGDGASEWTHVCLPMRYEHASALIATKAQRPMVDQRREPGALLWPALFSEARVRSLEVALGSYAAAGQLQQRPAPAEGGILKLKWLQYYEPESKPSITQVIISADTALKEKQQNDFSVIQAWGVHGPQRFALRRVRGRWGLGELIQQIKDMHRWALEQYPEAGVLVLIENTAAGPDAIRALRRQITGVVPWNKKGDKVQCAMAAQPVLEAGNVIVPGAEAVTGGRPDTGLTPGWVQEMLTEWAGFPNAAHDDDVDAFTQMIIRLQQNGPAIQSARLEAFL